jgi:hypothetical protein
MRERQPAATAPNELWPMAFLSDVLFDGSWLRALTAVDAFTREALAIDVDQGIKGEQVVEVMTRISAVRGAPRAIRVDNGPEFISKALDRWANENGVRWTSHPRASQPTAASWNNSTDVCAGMPTAEICRRHGISLATFYKWKSKFGGMEVSEAKRLRALEDEKAKLNKLLAEAMLDIPVLSFAEGAVLKDITGKKW